MWSSGVGRFMATTLGRVIQIALVLLGIAGLVLLGFRRRWWETLCLAAPIVLVTAVGAASLAAPRRNEILMTLIFPLAGLAVSTAAAALSSRPQMVPLAGIFPAELTALRAVGLALALILDRLRGRPPAQPAQRRRAPAGARRAGAGDRHRHRSRQRPALRLLLRKGQRRADPRPRRLRDLHPLHHHPAGALGRGAQLAPALGGARGARLGGVPPGRPARPLQGQDRDPDPRLQRGGEHRRRPRPDARRGLRRAHRGPGRRRRLPRRHRRRRRRARRPGRPPRHQPRRRRGAAHRLPADGRIGGADRRHPRRRRPAPPLGDAAPGRTGPRAAKSTSPTAPASSATPTATPAPGSSGSSSSTASSPSSPAPTSPTARTATAPSAPPCCRSWSCARSSSTPPSS